MRYLTIALTKGRLAEKTLEMFEKIGITCEEMRDKSSRKLIFVNEDLKLRFFLAKGPDVPTYVEYGAADIGVTGKDIILEILIENLRPGNIILLHDSGEDTGGEPGAPECETGIVPGSADRRYRKQGTDEALCTGSECTG